MQKNSPTEQQLAKIEKLSELVQKAFQEFAEISDKIAQKWQIRLK